MRAKMQEMMYRDFILCIVTWKDTDGHNFFQQPEELAIFAKKRLIPDDRCNIIRKKDENYPL